MIREKVEEIIELKIRPYLKNHNGDLEVLDLRDGVVKIKFLGQCQGCPSAKYTIEDIVKSALMIEIPDVKDVILESHISEEMLDIAKKILYEKE